MTRSLPAVFVVTLAFLAGCVAPLPPSPQPRPQPPPIPVPVPVPEPIPVPPHIEPPPPPQTAVIEWAVVERVRAGLTRAELVDLVGYDPGEKNDRKQDDGTYIIRWPAVDQNGGKRWMDVQTENGVVLGKALWPR